MNKTDAINKAVDELDIPPMATYPILSDLYDAGVEAERERCANAAEELFDKFQGSGNGRRLLVQFAAKLKEKP